MSGRKDYPDLNEAMIDSLYRSTRADLEAGRLTTIHPSIVLALLDVTDQGCEQTGCPSMVADRLDMPEDPEFDKTAGHYWICGEHWNEAAETTQRLREAIRQHHADIASLGLTNRGQWGGGYDHKLWAVLDLPTKPGEAA